MRRLLKWAFVLAVIGEWYTRGGADFLFGPALPEGEAGLDVIREWYVVPPPSLRHTYTDAAAASLVGVKIRNADGVEMGEILEAERLDDGSAHVRYWASRAALGYPINVALAQAEHAVRAAAYEHAIPI